MRRIAVYREGDQMAAQIGPDLVIGMAGFGDAVTDAMRDLADLFAKHSYELGGNSVGVEVAGTLIEVKGQPGQTPRNIIRALAGIVEQRGFQEGDFREPDWTRLANEERVCRLR